MFFQLAVPASLRWLAYRRARVLIAGAVLAGLPLVVAACGDDPTRPGVPATPASIEGRVTAVTVVDNFRGTLLVESEPDNPTGGDKARVTIGPSAYVFVIAGTEGDTRSLAVGQWVRVWYTGAVAESFPVQAVASAVKIDSASTGVGP